MKKMAIFLFFLSSTLTAEYNPYENASSPVGQEIFKDFRRFFKEVMSANRKRKAKVRLSRKTTSCKDRCGEERSHTDYCHCDEKCQLVQDCCYDYLKRCKPNVSISYVERSKWQCISDLHRQHVFLPWYDEKFRLPRIKGHAMISSCLNCSGGLQKDCSNPPDPDTDEAKIPVEGPDGHTYKNRFCALGNGINSHSVKSWGYELICNKLKGYNKTQKLRDIINSCIKNEDKNCLPQDEAFLRHNCTWYRAPPLNITKSHTVCSPVETCPHTPDINITALEYHELRLKCEAYMRVVYRNGTYYKNFHCALCHGIRPVEIQNPPHIGFGPTISIFFEIPKPRPHHDNEKTKIEYPSNVTAGIISNGSKSSDTFTSKWDTYISLISLSISMATLLLLLALYSLVKELRTTPGKIIIGLSTSILVYQTVLLASPLFTEDAVECSITAICLHFAILSTFAWMGVMSFDVWKTFGKSNQKRVTKKTSTFLYYCLYVVITPVIVVLTAIAFDRSGVMLVYWRDDGESRSCWIVDNLSNILFFKVPIGISLSLNVIAFIWTIFGIRSVRNKSMQYNSSRKNNQAITSNVKMYGKLSVVMGLTWLLGFSIKYSVILKFIYLVVNNLQGFFIFLAFVTNKRVMEKCKASRPSWSQGSNTAMKISSGSTNFPLIKWEMVEKI